jgi:hypothetical protein
VDEVVKLEGVDLAGVVALDRRAQPLDQLAELGVVGTRRQQRARLAARVFEGR